MPTISPQKKLRLFSHSLVTLSRDDLRGFKISTEPPYADFSLEGLFLKSIGCQKVKDSEKRQVFLIQTPDNDYFLKIAKIS